MANKLDPDWTRESALGLAECALALGSQTTVPLQLSALTQAIVALADDLDPDWTRQAARELAERTARETDGLALYSLSEAITALTDKLDSEQAHESTPEVAELAVVLAIDTTDADQLQWLAEAIAAATKRSPNPPMLFASIELLKLPLGGNAMVTQPLLQSITQLLDYREHSSDFSRQSFWAVMQHLAELKAANPDWDWLDLARPPLPPDELVATFRRLCADPPDWPAALQA